MMKNIIILFTTGFLFGCSGGNTSQSQPAESNIDGAQLFKINCAQCHKPKDDFIGPALKDAGKRWKDKNLLYEFVRNSSEVIQKDAYAKALFDKYKQSPMLPMPGLSNEEIDAIFKYCDGSQ